MGKVIPVREIVLPYGLTTNFFFVKRQMILLPFRKNLPAMSSRNSCLRKPAGCNGKVKLHVYVGTRWLRQRDGCDKKKEFTH